MPPATPQPDDVAVVWIDNPPVNALSLATRRRVLDGLAAAQATPAVRAIVLAGRHGTFSAGADIAEFDGGKALALPTLVDLIEAVEASSKPVVAAVAGTALGGGLELTLGCHARAALADATVGLPEVKLGLIPGAGGTQRLPRLIAPEAALDLIVTGSPSRADDGRLSGLFDVIVKGSDDLLTAATSLASSLAGSTVTPTSARPAPVLSATALDEARRRHARAVDRVPAVTKAIEAIAFAANRPFAEGLAFERAAFGELLETTASKALRHLFFAERAAARVADPLVAAASPRPLARAGVIGAGTMGSGIAYCLADAGLSVTVVDTTPAALDRARATVERLFERAVGRGRRTRADADAALGRLSYSDSLDGLRDADLVIEAVFEDLATKQVVLANLDRVAKPGAVLATNTSTLDIDAIAAATGRPSDVLGLHFFSPAAVMRLVEVVRGARSAPDVVATGMRLARRLGKIGVLAKVCDGFIGNRMVEEYFRQALFLLEEGVLPHQVDEALESFGFAMGPFRVADLAGLDIGLAIRTRRRIERPDRSYPTIIDDLPARGRLGQKTGAGIYRYPDGRTPQRDREIEHMIANRAGRATVAQTAVLASEIVERCVFALVNEGARVLEEGIAQRASDIDVVYGTGYGFPAERGGPMFYADTVGLDRVVGTMRGLAQRFPKDRAFWEPAALLERLAASGQSFTSEEAPRG